MLPRGHARLLLGLWALAVSPALAASRAQAPVSRGPILLQTPAAASLKALPALSTLSTAEPWTLSLEPGVTLRAVLAEPGALARLESTLIVPVEAASPAKIELPGADGKPLAREPEPLQASRLPAVRRALQRMADRGLSAGGGERLAASLPAVFEGSARAPGPVIDAAEDGRDVGEWLKPSLSGKLDGSAAAVERLRSSVEKVLPLFRRSVGARVRVGARLTLDDACCGLAAPDLGYLLRRAGHPVRIVEAEFHVYVAQPHDGTILVVDPTIRQFFGGAAAPAAVPQVFVGTLGELKTLFSRNERHRTSRWSVSRIYLDQGVIRDERLLEVRRAVEEPSEP